MTDWERTEDFRAALRERRPLEVPQPPEPEPEKRHLTIQEAITRFTDDAKSGRKLQRAQLMKYMILHKQLKKFADEQGITLLKDMVDALVYLILGLVQQGLELPKIHWDRGIEKHFTCSGS